MERVSYNIGWDFAGHGMILPEHASAEVRVGYLNGQNHFGQKTIPADRFVRKWLQLRFNALLRQRVFSDDVTPQFLEAIDTPICPITRIVLTHGSGADTDWSVDRLINDGGYVPHNLMIMSTRANTAKESCSLKGIQEKIEGDDFPILSRTEWSRLYVVVEAAYGVAGLPIEKKRLLPLLHGKPGHLPTSTAEALQELVVHYIYSRSTNGVILESKTQKAITQVKRSCDDNQTAKKLFQKLIKRLDKYFPYVEYPADIFWNTDTFNLFLDLAQYQFQRGAWPLPFMENDVAVTSEEKRMISEEMAYQSRGYF